MTPRRLVKLDANTLSPPTSHLPGIPLMSLVSSPRPIYLCIDDSQIYWRRPPGQQLPHRRLDVIRNLRSSGLLKPASLHRRILRRRRYIHLHASLSDFLLEKASSWKASYHEWLSSVSSADTPSSNPSQRDLRGKDSSRTSVPDRLSNG